MSKRRAAIIAKDAVNDLLEGAAVLLLTLLHFEKIL